jgi:hypothetical protein
MNPAGPNAAFNDNKMDLQEIGLGGKRGVYSVDRINICDGLL